MEKDADITPNPPSPGPAGSVPETEVRAMRDRVFGHTASDSNWEGCREYWMQPNEVQWLKDQLPPNKD